MSRGKDLVTDYVVNADMYPVLAPDEVKDLPVVEVYSGEVDGIEYTALRCPDCKYEGIRYKSVLAVPVFAMYLNGQPVITLTAAPTSPVLVCQSCGLECRGDEGWALSYPALKEAVIIVSSFTSTCSHCGGTVKRGDPLRCEHCRAKFIGAVSDTVTIHKDGAVEAMWDTTLVFPHLEQLSMDKARARIPTMTYPSGHSYPDTVLV